MASPETAAGKVLVAVVSIKDLIPVIMVPCGEEETTWLIPSPSGSRVLWKWKQPGQREGADVLFKGKQTFGSHLVCLLSLKWNLPSAWLASSLLGKPLEPGLLSSLLAGSWDLPFWLWTSDSSVEWLYQPATKDICSFWVKVQMFPLRLYPPPPE